MSFTENNIAQSLTQETPSLTPKPVSFLVALLLGGVLAAVPSSITRSPEDYSAIEVPSSKSQTIHITTWLDETEYYQIRTPLGRQLLAIRKKAISKGLTLLDANEIRLEISRRRGELV